MGKLYENELRRRAEGRNVGECSQLRKWGREVHLFLLPSLLPSSESPCTMSLASLPLWCYSKKAVNIILCIMCTFMC